MKKKALLVAVDDYQTSATRLRAPVQEAASWSAMLQSPLYGFERRNIEILTNAQATRGAVLDALERLLGGAQTGDQLVFGAFCHGTIAFGWQTRTRISRRPEHSLVMFPNGDSDLQNAVITDSDLGRILRDTEPPLGTDITFVIEACFSGGLEIPFAIAGRSAKRRADPRQPIPLRAPSPIGVEAFPDAVPLGTFAVRRLRAAIERPVIVAACGASESAFQILGPDGNPRLVFSMKALPLLSSSRHKFADLAAALNPLEPGLPQTATLGGNPDRHGEEFPGQAGGQPGDTETLERRRNEPENETIEPVEPVAPRERRTVARLSGGPAAPRIDVRVLGQCCFVTAQNAASDGYQQRIVMPYDFIGTGAKHHFPFIEIADDDLITFTDVQPSQTYRRANGGVEYFRWDLAGHRISITNGIFTDPMTKSAAFTRHIPRMTLLAPELYPRPRNECFANVPNPSLFGAFFDIPSGAATIGKLDEGFTIFRRASGEEPWGPERTPQTVIVAEVPFSGSVATITLTSQSSGSPDVILSVRPGSSIFTGNAREEDITGPGANDTPSEEFLIMYTLSHFVLGDPPLPVPSMVPVDSCTPTDWP